MERPPAVAGRFYPDDDAELRDEVARLIGPTTTENDAIAVIAPHAGYLFSGAVAAEAYRQVRVPSVVVVLCPNHTGSGARAAIMSAGTWRIPGSSIPIDATVAEALRGTALLTEDRVAHAGEHSLEVHLPFLAHRNPKVRIVPVCLSHVPYDACVRIGSALADAAVRNGRDVLIVASTDMSHYEPAAEARRKDEMALDAIRALDPKRLHETVQEHDISMCGYIPTTVALVAANALGATSADLVRYSNSGDVSGDYAQVVGYASLVIR